MPTIKEVKKELRRREWAQQIAECQASGMTIKDWCRANSVSSNTYYRHLRIVRLSLLEKTEHPLQKIVPLSMSAELSEHSENNISLEQRIVMRKDGIEIELPQGISENTLIVMLRGLKQC